MKSYEKVRIPRSLMSDFERWLCRYGRRVFESPTGEKIVGEPHVRMPRASVPGRLYDPERDSERPGHAA